MIDAPPVLAFATVSLLMAISPGPSWAYTISTTLGHGRACGMIGNLGNSAGILVHAAAATAGLSALIAYSATAFNALKIVGAAYLVYLGISAFRGRGLFAAPTDRADRTRLQIFRGGALVNILNPKMSLLFIALMPQFVVVSADATAAAATPTVQIATMGFMHAAIALFVHTNVVLASGAIARRLSDSGRAQRVVRWTLGSLFIAFGVRLAVAR